jgi:hypothetical protein
VSRLHHREVARIGFRVRVPDGATLIDDGLLSAPFQRASPDLPGRVEIDVEVRLGERLPVRTAPPLFDTGSAWRSYREGVDTVLELTGGPDREPLLLARLAGQGEHVTIHVSPQAVASGKGVTAVHGPLQYPLGQLLLMHVLPFHGGLLLHAAGLRGSRSAVVFPGRSGAGKSTLTRLLLDESVDLAGLSDERIIVRQIDGEPLAFGTPWAGTAGLAANAGARLAALAFLHQAPENHLEPLTPQRALDQLLPVASILWHDPDRTSRTLQVCEELLARVPAYELHFRNTPHLHETVEGLFRG